MAITKRKPVAVKPIAIKQRRGNLNTIVVAAKPSATPPISNDDATVAMLADTFVFPDAFFIEPGSKNHLLEDYLPGPGSVSLIIAKPGVGKTTLIADFVFTYAYKNRYEDMGLTPVPDGEGGFISMPLIEYGTFLNQRITQRPRPVLYMALEGHRQLQLLGAAYTKEQSSFVEFTQGKKKQRMKFKKQLRLMDKEHFEPVVFLKDGNTPKLDNDAEYKELVTRIDGLIAFFKANEYASPGIIVIDTGSRTLEGEENSNTIISKVMSRCAEMARHCKASVLILHHTPRTTNTPRGGSAWEGAADCVWLLSGNAKTCVTLSVEKFKGFILPDELYFKIVPVETEFMDKDRTDGRKLSSARIEQMKSPPPANKKNSTKDEDDVAAGKLLAASKRSPEEKHAALQHDRLDILRKAWKKCGSETTKDGYSYITKSGLREYLFTEKKYSENTINQALKPAADPTRKSSLIGPLLTDAFIAVHEHGWIILAEMPDIPA
jgi:hypothetical protein